MRRITLLFILFIIGFASCSGDDNKFLTSSFDITVDIPVIGVPGSPVPLDIPEDAIPAIPIDLKDYDQYLTYSFDFIQKAEVKRISFYVIDESDDPAQDTSEPDPPDPDYFDTLNAAEIYIMANLHGAVEQRLVAYLPENDPQLENGSTHLVMKMTDADIHRFIQNDKFDLYVVATGQLPPDNLFINGRAIIRITVGLWD